MGSSSADEDQGQNHTEGPGKGGAQGVAGGAKIQNPHEQAVQGPAPEYAAGGEIPFHESAFSES